MRSNTSGTSGSLRFALLAGAAGFALTAPTAAFAQDSDADAAAEALGEEGDSNVIIVTASKREQTLQETPISVSVTTGETLENAQIRDVLDLQTVTPSLRVSQLQSSSNTTFIIRGFGNGANNFGIEPSVGVFIDGVFRSRSAGALSDLPNVQRIEVLNGPQSTLFGKNASAGVISVVTREPQFEFGGNIEASYGNYNAFVLKGDITGPLAENVAFSIDGSYNIRDGYGEIVNLDEDVNDRDRWALRGQLLVEPTPDVKIRAIADYARFNEVCCTVGTLVAGPTAAGITAVGGQIQAPADFFSREVFYSVIPENEAENYGASVQADWNTGPLTLTSITSYRELKNAFTNDIDFTSADIANETRDQAVKTFTQEFRIASDFDGPINFLLGGFYFDESIDQVSQIENGANIRDFFEILAGEDPVAVLTGQPTLFNGLEQSFGFPQESIFATPLLTAERFSMTNEAFSVFGTVDFEPVEGLVLTAGFNYTDDSKDFALRQTSFDPLAQVNFVDAFITQATMGAVTNRDQFQALPAANQAALIAAATDPAVNPLLGLAAFQFQPPFLAVPNSVEPATTSDDELTYLLRVAYEVTPDINVYASYSTGFKASSVNLSRDSRPLNTDFVAGPGGSTFAAPDSNIIAAGLAVPNLVSGSRFAGPEETEVYEVGLKAQFDGFGFNLALFDQTIDGFQSFAFTGTGFALRNAGTQSVKGFEFDATANPVDGLALTFAATYLDPLFDSFIGSTIGDLSGLTPAGIPEWSVATSATYSHEFESGIEWITRVDYNYESSVQISDGFRAPGDQPFTRSVNLVNASTTVKLENGLELGLWARNLFDDEFISTIFPGVAQEGTVSGYPNQPRTYGGVVRFRF